MLAMPCAVCARTMASVFTQVRHVFVFKGGELNFVYSTGTDGLAYWAETENSVAAGRPWNFPISELGDIPFAGKLANLLIRGEGQTGCRDGLDSSRSRCSGRQRNLSLPEWGQPDCCWTEDKRQDGVMTLQRMEGFSIDQAGDGLQQQNCEDLLDPERWIGTEKTHTEGLFAGFADIVNNYSTCPGGCLDRFRPLCKEGQCVTPTCADAAKFCHAFSMAGQSARMFCPITCGCDDPLSPLIQNGENWGCPPSCRTTCKNRSAKRSCADAEVGSAELMAYGDPMIECGQLNRQIRSVKIGRDLREQGCTSIPTVLCAPSTGFKSVYDFCPATCGCREGAVQTTEIAGGHLNATSNQRPQR